jgi:hypothetical protein
MALYAETIGLASFAMARHAKMLKIPATRAISARRLSDTFPPAE